MFPSISLSVYCTRNAYRCLLHIFSFTVFYCAASTPQRIYCSCFFQRRTVDLPPLLLCQGTLMFLVAGNGVFFDFHSHDNTTAHPYIFIYIVVSSQR